MNLAVPNLEANSQCFTASVIHPISGANLPNGLQSEADLLSSRVLKILVRTTARLPPKSIEHFTDETEQWFMSLNVSTPIKRRRHRPKYASMPRLQRFTAAPIISDETRDHKCYDDGAMRVEKIKAV